MQLNTHLCLCLFVLASTPAARITGPVSEPTDYSTTTNLAHEATLRAPHGPTFVASIAPPRRSSSREAQIQAEAARILAERDRAREEALDRELAAASFAGRGDMNRRRGLVSERSLETSARANPLNGQAISFHTHNIGAIHGVTPTDRGVHTFSRNTTFSKPIEELLEEGTR